MLGGQEARDRGGEKKNTNKIMSCSKNIYITLTTVGDAMGWFIQGVSS